MLAHDPGRSGATPVEIRPPFERKWYRLFPEEGIQAGVQPIVADGVVYVGTLRGVLHAIDARSGDDRWTFQAGGPILHACAALGGAVFFGCADGQVYALRATDGRALWTHDTGTAIWNAPVVHEGTVIVASRIAVVALDAQDALPLWSYRCRGPILSSPALDARRDHVYVASEDMRVQGLVASSGRLLWESERLPGVTFRGYHPVVAPDGSVLVATAPAISLDTIQTLLLDMVREVFGDFASWRHTKEENERIREENFELLKRPETYRAQLDYLRRRLVEEPAYQTFFVLDPKTGKRRCVPPIVYAESMNGTGAPPVVTPDGKVIVKYQALLRSRYEHYSPFLNVGYLDTESGHIEPIMDPTRTYGWHDSLLLVHDEQCQLSVAGRVLINTHQDNVNAMDLETLRGYAEPFCRNIHEPREGEALGIWKRLLEERELPPGKEWLIRGTAVYGGGSVIDTAVSIAGNSFYYIPTHEMSAGAAVIAYRMAPEGEASATSPPPTEELSEREWARVRELPWDWDTLEASRMRKAVGPITERVPGTRGAPLTEEADARLRAVEDSALDALIWQASRVDLSAVERAAAYRRELETKVRELILETWRPLLFPAGKHPSEAYRFFADPAEMLLVLASAYPYLGPELQGEVRDAVARLGSVAGTRAGKVRSYYDEPPSRLVQVRDDIRWSDVAALYPLWLWSYGTGDRSLVESRWPEIRKLSMRPPEGVELDCGNGEVAGRIAYCRLAALVGDQDALEDGLRRARQAMRDRLRYELAHPRGGLLVPAPVLRTIAGRWRHLTPEVGRLLATYAGETQAWLMERYVDHHRPTWWLAWNVETVFRNECSFELPTLSMEVFSARALVLGESGDELARYVDLPWCHADPFHLHKSALALEGRGKRTWVDVRSPEDEDAEAWAPFDVRDEGPRDAAAPVFEPWKVVTLDADYGGHWVVTGDVDGDGAADVVSAKNFNENDVHDTSAAVAQRLDGSVLWTWGDPARGRKEWHHDVACQIHDWDGDGRNEVVLATKGALVELDGATGAERRRFPLPPDATDCLVFANLGGGGRPTDVLVKTRYTRIWAYDRKGRLLWSVEQPGGARTAHQPYPVDIDGDGRDEILAGYALLNPDGSVRWRYRSSSVDESRGHLDCARLLRRGETPADHRIVLTCCGANNLACVDGNGGVLWELSGHHFESIQVGTVDPDHPGPQILVDIDHRPKGESPLWLLDANGRRLGQILGYYFRHHALLDWDGDGLEEIVIADSRGVFDRRGRRIATLRADGRGVSLLLGDMTGDGVSDVTIVTGSPPTVHVFRNEKGRPAAGEVPLGCGVNFTLY